MHASTATFFAGGSGRSPLSNCAEYASLLATSSSVTLIGAPYGRCVAGERKLLNPIGFPGIAIPPQRATAPKSGPSVMRLKGLEPPRALRPRRPERRASTSSATAAADGKSGIASSSRSFGPPTSASRSRPRRPAGTAARIGDSGAVEDPALARRDEEIDDVRARRFENCVAQVRVPRPVRSTNTAAVAAGRSRAGSATARPRPWARCHGSNSIGRRLRLARTGCRNRQLR